jgi:hypothetical protein
MAWVRMAVGMVVTAAFVVPVPEVLGKVVVGQSIAGVRIGATQAQVRRALGKPLGTSDGWRYGEPLRGRVIFGRDHRVVEVWSHSRRQRTGRSIGRGSTVRSVRRAYRVTCGREAGVKWTLICRRRSRSGGHRRTTTFYFDGRLSVIAVSKG